MRTGMFEFSINDPFIWYLIRFFYSKFIFIQRGIMRLVLATLNSWIVISCIAVIQIIDTEKYVTIISSSCNNRIRGCYTNHRPFIGYQLTHWPVTNQVMVISWGLSSYDSRVWFRTYILSGVALEGECLRFELDLLCLWYSVLLCDNNGPSSSSSLSSIGGFDIGADGTSS